MRLAAAVIALLLGGPAAAPQDSPFRFHHLHLNGAGLADFYARLFPPESLVKTPVAGYAALRSGTMLLLFGPRLIDAPPFDTGRRSVDASPRSGPSAIWHFGWGDASLGETYLQHAQREVEWEPPLPPDKLHLHLLSASPGTAATWYRDVFDAHIEVMAGDMSRRTAAARAEWRVAEALVRFEEFAMLIYRTGEQLQPTRGKRVDHVAFTCGDLEGTVARLRADNVAVIDQSITFGDKRAVLVEGPDKIAIELISR